MSDTRTGIFGPASAGHDARGGGILPSIRPHYHPHVARALHELAESRPPWPEYLRERARILQPHYDRKTSERLEQR